MSERGWQRRATRAIAAMILVAVAAAVWMPIATFAFFPYVGGEFHWVLHLSKPRQVAGIYGFAVTQVLAAAVFAAIVSCASRLNAVTVILATLLPVVAFNAIFVHPLVALLAGLTVVPYVAAAVGLWTVARRWPVYLPWPLVVVPPMIFIGPNVGGFTHFFPSETIFPAVWSALICTPIAGGLAVLLVRRFTPLIVSAEAPPFGTTPRRTIR